MSGKNRPTTVLNPATNDVSNDIKPKELPPLPDHYLVKDEELGPCLHGLFRRQAKTTPDRIAIKSPTVQITYAQLDRASDQLAAMLLEKNGQKPKRIFS